MTEQDNISAAEPPLDCNVRGPHDCTMAQAKRDFERGHLSHASLHKCGVSWVVMIHATFENSAGTLLDARIKTPRQFKTISAAIHAVEQIGFNVGWLMLMPNA